MEPPRLPKNLRNSNPNGPNCRISGHSPPRSAASFDLAVTSTFATEGVILLMTEEKLAGIEPSAESVLVFNTCSWPRTDLVKLDFLINGERVDALSMLIHRDNAVARARVACSKLKDEIPRQMFKIAIQGAIGGKIISRSTVNAFRTIVTSSISPTSGARSTPASGSRS